MNGNGDRGIQLYPAAQNVLISRNVIDSNGSGLIFSGAGSLTSRNVIVTRNIISNSRKRWNRKHDTILFYTRSDRFTSAPSALYGNLTRLCMGVLLRRAFWTPCVAADASLCGNDSPRVSRL